MADLDYGDCVDQLLAAADDLLETNVVGCPEALDPLLQNLGRSVSALRQAEAGLREAALDGQRCVTVFIGPPAVRGAVEHPNPKEHR